MESKIDKIFKESVANIEKKPIEWNKGQSWAIIQKRRKTYYLKQLYKYAAIIVFVLFSASIIFVYFKGQVNDSKTLSRTEKYQKLNIIEQRLSHKKGAFFICNTCIAPTLIEGSKPISNRFRVNVFYKSI